MKEKLIAELNQLGLNAKNRGEFDEAIRYYQEALLLDSSNPTVLNNMGNAYKFKMDLEKAIECYDKAIKIDPDFEDVLYNRSLLYLLLGDYEKGKPRYEWLMPGHKFSGINSHNFKQTRPVWSGNKCKVLVYSYHGLGDNIQFVRYIKLLKKDVDEVYLQCHDELVDLFKNCPYIDKVYPLGKIDLDYDEEVEMLWLPYHYGKIINEPYLTPKPNSKIDKVLLPEKKVGIAWTGNPNHPNNLNRSCPLKYFLRIPEKKLYSLQVKQSYTREELSGNIFALHSLLKNMMDTAYAVSKMDVVVTVDTCIAHIAGALGKKTYLLLPYMHDWRWGLEDKTPWYPSINIIRQQSPKDWDSVFERLENLWES